jgi:rhodanese-related sulfurtransferase
LHEISVSELKRKRDANDGHLLLDVREPHEIETASLSGSLAIPMQDIPKRMGELPRDREIVVMCHGGRRSERVVQFLEQSGFDNLKNLAGGIDAWSREIDPSVPKY